MLFGGRNVDGDTRGYGRGKYVFAGVEFPFAHVRHGRRLPLLPSLDQTR